MIGDPGVVGLLLLTSAMPGNKQLLPPQQTAMHEHEHDGVHIIVHNHTCMYPSTPPTYTLFLPPPPPPSPFSYQAAAAAAGGHAAAGPSKRKRAAGSDDEYAEGSDSGDEFYDRTGAPNKRAATAAAAGAAGGTGAGKKGAGVGKGQQAQQVESAESLHAKR